MKNGIAVCLGFGIVGDGGVAGVRGEGLGGRRHLDPPALFLAFFPRHVMPVQDWEGGDGRTG